MLSRNSGRKEVAEDAAEHGNQGRHAEVTEA